jgi:photosystem II stability/assembly factor-like uncharacterized protein
MNKTWISGMALACAIASSAETKPAPSAEKPVEKGPYASGTWTGLELRPIGPAIASGRIADLAVDLTDGRRWFAAVASGGVWKTENAGTTWVPVFDKEASFSTGCVAIDPKNPSVVWVGTGENDSQRSVAYGDGVYRSEDGGRHWTNMGLKSSEHIARIVIDPRDSRMVYVAAQGPLWSAGGDRGLYKTTDGGKSWKAVLTISENTGVTDIAMDPRNPDVLYAAAYQRRRHVWSVVNGGPEAAIYRSSDAGATWEKAKAGLPEVDMGRIGLTIAPSDPDVVYASIEASQKKGGIYRSTDRGATWEKRSEYQPTSGMYYKGVVVDPKNKDLLYAYDTWIQVSHDAGKTFAKWGEPDKHPDNHTIWIDPADSRHILVGCDGGVYETFDTGSTWDFKANLPVTQFYRVAVDNALPFYNVYGGTQDNFSLGGPSRTTSRNGINNSDWFVTSIGDGFFSVVDPEDPNIVYSESQYGGLNRMDRRTGEQLNIQPLAGPGEPALRWNWDSPILVSPHSHTRVYFAAQKIFRSDDRGDTWTPISGDLTRQLDRNQMKIMGRLWSVDAVAKSGSTSFYGNIVALSESRKREGLLYAGTDDGLLQVTEDGGKSWRHIERFPGIPDLTPISRVTASAHDENVVYASFINEKMGDFRPYVLKSADRGRTWASIAGNLPARGSVHAIVEDPVDPKLLFCGTEFGLFFSGDGGSRWVQLKGNFPTIAVKDIAIQQRDNDLVLATFGRGFFVLDDYSVLRSAAPASLEEGPQTFAVRPVKAYVPTAALGLPGKAFQGASFYSAANPPFGALLTYYLKDEIQTRAEHRRKAEKEAEKSGKSLPYPTLAEMRSEENEEPPAVIATISDSHGDVVRRVTGPVAAGFHRIAWDLHYAPATPASKTPPHSDPFNEPPTGPLAVPGTYTVAFATFVDGKTAPFGRTQTIVVAGLHEIPQADREKLLAFERKTARLQRAVIGAEKAADEAKDRLELIQKTLPETAGAAPELAVKARELQGQLRDIQIALSSDPVAAHHNENTPPSISDRINYVVSTHWTATAAPTKTSRDAYEAAATEFEGLLAKLHRLVEVDLRGLESKMEQAGAPWTPGRVPEWKKD